MPGIVEAAFFNGGQDCTAATRVLGHESIHDELVARLVAHSKQHARTGVVDDPFDGPLNSAAQSLIGCRIHLGLPSYAYIAVGGHRVGTQGYFLAPDDRDARATGRRSRAKRIFGPVLTVQSFGSESEALTLANGVPFALAASVWTEDHRVAMRMSRDLDFGCVWINAHLPFVSAYMSARRVQAIGIWQRSVRVRIDDYTRIKHVMSRLGHDSHEANARRALTACEKRLLTSELDSWNGVPRTRGGR